MWCSDIKTHRLKEVNAIKVGNGGIKGNSGTHFFCGWREYNDTSIQPYLFRFIQNQFF